MRYDSIPASVQRFMDHITELCGSEHEAWARNFNACFANTLLTTVRRHDDGTTFVLTGDIPAMWLRDSTAQVRPYLAIAGQDADLADMIAGLVRMQFRYIGIDPYANAFNEEPNGNTWDPNDQTDVSSPWFWERKYELDSLCYPIQLAWLLHANTGRCDHFDETFIAGIRRVLDVIETEQDHAARSPYFFVRDCDIPTESLARDGRGTPVADTGMSWSGFRPSDDACTYHYLVPSNMFAVVVLGYVERIFTDIIPDEDIARRAGWLSARIRDGIETHARVSNAAGETIYAYEVDGLGHAVVMDDANVPSLLAAPYLGYCAADDPTYLATRRTLLGEENPYYYAGPYTRGIGSPHTPERYVWPIARSIEGLTCEDREAKAAILDNLVAIDAGTNLMHEGVCVDDPTKYTREWFSWSNMMFCELVMDYFGIRVKR
ncbi:glycoside hydrolase family 125 protein [Bifidobacterium eulemuris]|uniref:Glycoside hydrolase family 125 protein n=1 Tax=Bifidobacterium eulemuris TaxID=1765219 RepID=A0A261G9I7_9BIFI|nr:glycoside hydrolase family 125 protein [Bifidobacterium eulemuris]OZG68070.1 glycosyl hydrolase [Bifidobacterium eulemuris]QOL31856.1 glycoside hydrolase family 125 protein [Bifidobacterium eulemuris]